MQCAKFNLSFLKSKKVFARFFTAVPYNKLTLETSNGDVDGGHAGVAFPSPFIPSLFSLS